MRSVRVALSMRVTHLRGHSRSCVWVSAGPAVQPPEELEDTKPVVDRVAASVQVYMNGSAAKWYLDCARAYAKMMSVGECRCSCCKERQK